MRKFLFVGAVAAAMVAAALTVSFAGGGTVTSATTLTVREHAVNEKVIDLAGNGDTAGDLLVFHNPIFNKSNTKQIGKDQGECIRISVGDKSWQCHWTTKIKGRGSIAVDGPFYDNRDSKLAITGGTGDFRKVRGYLALSAAPGGYSFAFHLLP
jgi:allene oxide cyclase